MHIKLHSHSEWRFDYGFTSFVIFFFFSPSSILFTSCVTRSTCTHKTCLWIYKSWKWAVEAIWFSWELTLTMAIFCTWRCSRFQVRSILVFFIIFFCFFCCELFASPNNLSDHPVQQASNLFSCSYLFPSSLYKNKKELFFKMFWPSSWLPSFLFASLVTYVISSFLLRSHFLFVWFSSGFTPEIVHWTRHQLLTQYYCKKLSSCAIWSAPWTDEHPIWEEMKTACKR